MKKLVYFFLIVLMFAGCVNKDIELKKISIVKCRSCGKILEGPDTTIVRGRYSGGKDFFKSVEGKVYFLGYNYNGKVRKVINDIDNSTAVCEKCRKKFKKEAKEYFKKGKRAYSVGNWMQAENYFKNAIKVFPEAEEYPEADKWLEKTKKKLAIIREREEIREIHKQQAEARRERAKEEREEEKLELTDRFVESGIKFGIISDVYREMNYELKHYTLSSQIQSKIKEIERYTDDTFIPAANEFNYYLNRYIDKYGILAARDLAIKNGFLHLLK